MSVLYISELKRQREPNMRRRSFTRIYRSSPTYYYYVFLHSGRTINICFWHNRHVYRNEFNNMVVCIMQYLYVVRIYNIMIIIRRSSNNIVLTILYIIIWVRWILSITRHRCYAYNIIIFEEYFHIMERL